MKETVLDLGSDGRRKTGMIGEGRKPPSRQTPPNRLHRLSGAGVNDVRTLPPPQKPMKPGHLLPMAPGFPDLPGQVGPVEAPHHPDWIPKPQAILNLIADAVDRRSRQRQDRHRDP